MELRHLRYFAAVADQLSFTRAAEKVHVTQSTLSHQIKQLEDEIGLRLFNRIGKRVVITDTGEMLLNSVTKALREIDEGLQAVKGAASPLSGTIRVGATHTFGISLIPSCIALFQSAEPTVGVEVRELSSSAVERALLGDEIELGIAYNPNNHAALFFEPLYIEDMYLVVSKEHRFAGRKRLRMLELHRQELVLSNKESATRQMIDSRFQSVGAEPIVVAEMNSVAGMLSLVRRAKIGAIVSQLAVSDADDLSIIQLDSPKPLRTPGLLWKTNKLQSAAVRTFANTIRAVVSDAKMRPPK